MEDELIMTEWISDKSGNDMVQANINYQFTPAILAYFDSNIVYTFNYGSDSLCYNTHIIPPQNEIDEAVITSYSIHYTKLYENNTHRRTFLNWYRSTIQKKLQRLRRKFK